MTDDRDTRTDLAVEELGPADARAAAEVLRDAEASAGGELVDEAERRRLEAFADDPTAPAERWHPVVAHLADEGVGYAAVVLPAGDADDGTAVADAAVVPWRADRPRVLAALLARLTDLATNGGASHLQVWCRRVDEADVSAAAEAGLFPERRLAVLGRALDDAATGAPAMPSGVRIRGYVPDDDDAEVVRVLSGAYAGTDEEGSWDLLTLRTKREWEWFRPEDLLVAEDDDGRLLGVHWLKRRDATTGEVHNLAIHPHAQGRGLGAVLLHAGLEHLAGLGCREVLLWVDRANGRAVRLYEAHGFTTRWDDVAFGRELSAPPAPS